ncbi:MAG: hemolysin family protein [Thermoplasmata archaeon]
MEMMHIAYLLSLVVLIYLSGRFSGAETALTALSKVDIAQMNLEGEKNVDVIIKLKSNMDNTIITILVGNNLVNISASAISTKFAYELLGNLGISIAVGVVTILILVFAEITPKGFAIKNKREFSIKNAKFIFYFSRIFYPLIIGLRKISNKLIKLLGGKTRHEKTSITESDVRVLASLLEEEGQIKEIEKNIVHNVFWFGDVRVRSVKIPKEDSFVLDSSITVDEGVEFIKEHGLTRIPVAQHGSDHIMGILYSKNLLGEEIGTMGDYARDVPMVVKNDHEITEVFQRMRKNRIHMAIVEDDNGNFDGLITLEDIVEELLGEIYDEFDRE